MLHTGPESTSTGSVHPKFHPHSNLITILSSASIFTACIFALSGVVSATLLAQQAQAPCNPSFEGAGVSIILGSNEWGVSPAACSTAPWASDPGSR
jgi:hypothetical protein